MLTNMCYTINQKCWKHECNAISPSVQLISLNQIWVRNWGKLISSQTESCAVFFSFFLIKPCIWIVFINISSILCYTLLVMINYTYKTEAFRFILFWSTFLEGWNVWVSCNTTREMFNSLISNRESSWHGNWKIASHQ